ncbi:hypothetical protein LCGC14_2657800, partial [marine sediment metagenome]
DNNVRMVVSNGGDGIDEDLKPRIFEPFFTTKSEGTTGGLGLGLAISRSLAEAAGGALTFQSVTGKGCEFLLTLPLIRTSIGATDALYESNPDRR